MFDVINVCTLNQVAVPFIVLCAAAFLERTEEGGWRRRKFNSESI